MKLAKKLYRMYFEHLYARVRVGRLVVLPYSACSDTYKKLFKKLAKQLLIIKADPAIFMLAQFEAFEALSQILRRKRAIFPQPNQLVSTGAQVRYFSYMAAQQEKGVRKESAQKAVQIDKYVREERKLLAYAKRLRMTAVDVLLENPSEFTEGFLRRKRVWKHVKDVYMAEI